MNKIKIFFILIIIVGVSYGIKKVFLEKKTGDTAVTNAMSVTVVSPEYKTISEELHVTGVTIPREEVMITTELAGVRVQEVYAEVGDKVIKGQKLVTLDAASLKNQLAQLQSDYDRAFDEFKRIEAIKDKGAVSKEAVVQKRTAMQLAKARLDDAKLNLNRSVITAPVEGVIFERKAVIGALVSTTEPLYRIARYNEIELAANVPEAQMALLKTGLPAQITFTGGNHTIMGEIRAIEPRIDSANRTGMVRIHLDNLDVNMVVGLFGNVSIEIEKVSGLTLPASALQQDRGGDYVWLLDKQNKAFRHKVDLKSRTNDVIIVEGLSAEVRVVARAGAFVKAGDSLNVIKGK